MPPVKFTGCLSFILLIGKAGLLNPLSCAIIVGNQRAEKEVRECELFGGRRTAPALRSGSFPHTNFIQLAVNRRKSDRNGGNKDKWQARRGGAAVGQGASERSAAAPTPAPKAPTRAVGAPRRAASTSSIINAINTFHFLL